MIPGSARSACAHRSGRWIALLGLLLSVPLSAVAEPPVRIVTPAGGETLVAGDLVEVRWQGLPGDVDELELLLDVGDAAEVRVRLTPQLAGATHRYLWRVPNLPGRDARLRVRWGRDGVEVEGEPSVRFEIAADHRTPLSAVGFRDGEWWVGDPVMTREGPIDVVLRVLGDRVAHAEPGVVSTVEDSGAGHQPAADGPSSAGGRRLVHRAAGAKRATARCPQEFPLRP